MARKLRKTTAREVFELRRLHDHGMSIRGAARVVGLPPAVARYHIKPRDLRALVLGYSAKHLPPSRVAALLDITTAEVNAILRAS